MKNHELLDLIGGVNEECVLAAGSSVVRPRFRWKALAACAACAALALCAVPVWRMAHTGQDLPKDAAAPLHAYTVVDGTGGAVNTEGGEIKAAFPGTRGGGDIAPIPEAAGPAAASGEAETGGDPEKGGDAGADIDGAYYNASSGDAPVEEDPYNQYNNLFENARLDQYPEWYGGAYIECTALGESSKLVVCIVDGFHTAELEQQIAEWCGEGVWTYRDVKYSRGYLQELMERLNGSQLLAVMEEDKAVSGWGVYEEDNCIQMDCNGVPNDATLAALARLDPDGDAIRVRVFAGQTVNADIVKGPEPAADPEPVPDGGSIPVPGGARDGQPAAESSIGADEQDFPTETAQAARYGGQSGEEYGLLCGTDGPLGFGLLY